MANATCAPRAPAPSNVTLNRLFPSGALLPGVNVAVNCFHCVVRPPPATAVALPKTVPLLAPTRDTVMAELGADPLTTLAKNDAVYFAPLATLMPQKPELAKPTVPVALLGTVTWRELGNCGETGAVVPLLTTLITEEPTVDQAVSAAELPAVCPWKARFCS